MVGGRGVWTRLEVLTSTASTNADVVRAAAAGAAEGLVVTAEEQTAGRGRLGRSWSTPPRAALAVSVLLRPPTVPLARWGWLPLLSGLAVLDAVREVAQVDARLKWPNDVLVEDRKLAGILAQRVPAGAGGSEGVVVGVGLNVTLGAAELPVPTATSLLLEGAAGTDREPLLRALLRALGARYQRWCACGGDVGPVSAGGDGTRAAYERMCSTLGREVRVSLPGGGEVVGTAADVDLDGRLVVVAADTRVVVGAGDVIHVR